MIIIKVSQSSSLPQFSEFKEGVRSNGPQRGPVHRVHTDKLHPIIAAISRVVLAA